MGEIKSAWEIAQEKIKNISVDKESLEEQENVVSGKKLVSRFLDDPESVSPAEELKALSGRKRTQVKRGMIETFLANLALPLSEVAKTRNDRAIKGLLSLAPGVKPLQHLLGQIAQFFADYEGERGRVEEAVTAQYAPRLKQKAEALAKQLGTRVELHAMQDPEYVALLRKNLAAFDDRYGQALREAKREIERLAQQAP
ncbi:MAG: hypothetical protein JXD23_13625 [Spirochaetales bacterium]|nr:hypothetical protein [Spirochaetales bacterium]